MKNRKLNLLLLVSSMVATTLMASTAFAQDQEPEVDLCDDFYTCLDACEDGDGDCEEACLLDADPAVQETYLDAIACFLGSQCAEDDDQCIIEACGEEVVALDSACSGEDPDIACFDFLACAAGCDVEDENETSLQCLLDCTDDVADEQEREVISAALVCLRDSGCDLEDDACIEEACGEEGDALEAACELGDDEPGEDNNGDISVGENNGNNGDSNNGDDNNGGSNNGDVVNDGGTNNGGSNGADDTESDSGGDSEDSGCSVAPGQGGAGGTAMLLLLGLVALGLRRRNG